MSAVFSDSSKVLEITFDQPLTAGSLDPANWALVVTAGPPQVRTVDAPVAAGSTVVSPTSFLAVSPSGPSRVSYSPPPFDLRALAGAPAPPFADFPVVRVP